MGGQYRIWWARACTGHRTPPSHRTVPAVLVWAGGTLCTRRGEHCRESRIMRKVSSNGNESRFLMWVNSKGNGKSNIGKRSRMGEKESSPQVPKCFCETSVSTVQNVSGWLVSQAYEKRMMLIARLLNVRLNCKNSTQGIHFMINSTGFKWWRLHH